MLQFACNWLTSSFLSLTNIYYKLYFYYRVPGFETIIQRNLFWPFWIKKKKKTLKGWIFLSEINSTVGMFFFMNLTFTKTATGQNWAGKMWSGSNYVRIEDKASIYSFSGRDPSRRELSRSLSGENNATFFKWEVEICVSPSLCVQTLTDVANMVAGKNQNRVNYASVGSKDLISPVNITWQSLRAAWRVMALLSESPDRELPEDKWCINNVWNLDMGASLSFHVCGWIIFTRH